MEWTKIPTNLINGKFDDKEILSVVKYQLVYALYEEEPSDKILNRFLTKKQQILVKNFVNDITTNVENEITGVLKKRQKEKLRYSNNKGLGENSASRPVDMSADVLQEQIRLDKIRLDDIHIEEQKIPTKKEVEDYLTSICKKTNVDDFMNYWSATNWCDKDGLPINSWKQKALSWANKNPISVPKTKFKTNEEIEIEKNERLKKRLEQWMEEE